MSTVNNRPRPIAHLAGVGSPTAEECIRAVEDLFEGRWLRKEKGRHRLQILWARNDPFAASELYALGRAIKRLQPKHQQWLTSTAKTLKKDPVTSHGLITEILICGSTRGFGGAEVYPSRQGEPGVDFSVRFPGGFKYLVSVKNHDISIHEKRFVTACDELREVLIERLGILGKNGRLVVSCASYMTPDIFLICHSYVKNTLRETGVTMLLGGQLSLAFFEFEKEPDRDFAETMTSDLLIVWSGHHDNEQRNFRDKLKYAADNLKKHVRRSDDCARLLFMRVHFTANIEALEGIARQMLDAEWDCGFDFAMFTQSVGARTEEGSTLIHTVLRFAGSSDHQGLAQSVIRGERLAYELGIGSIGTERITSRLKLGDADHSDLMAERYEYQRGDYYYLLKQDSTSHYGAISSPAHGVHVHAVVNLEGHELLITPNAPEAEDVLIV